MTTGTPSLPRKPWTAEAERELVQLRDLRGLSWKEIALRTRRTYNAVAQRYAVIKRDTNTPIRVRFEYPADALAWAKDCIRRTGQVPGPVPSIGQLQEAMFICETNGKPL